MATQPMIEAHEELEPIPRDVEADARSQGWTPKEDFKGDEARWVDAETFVKRADEVMPLLKKQKQHFQNENATLKRDLKNLLGRFEGVEKRAYEKAMADIEGRMDSAAEVGDVAGVKKAREELIDLKRETQQGAPVATELEAEEAALEWRERNTWYDSDPLARSYADLVAKQNVNLAKTMRPSEYYAMVEEKVRERYGDRLDAVADDEVKPKPRKALSAVEAPRSGRRSSARTAADLPADAVRTADRFIRMGIIKTREDYAKTYQWDS